MTWKCWDGMRILLGKAFKSDDVLIYSMRINKIGGKKETKNKKQETRQAEKGHGP